MKEVIRFIFLFFIFLGLICCINNSSKVIVSRYDNGVVYLSEAIDEYNNLTSKDKNQMNDIDEYFRLVRKVALEKIILDKAYEQGLDKEDSIKIRLKKIKKDVGFEILQKKNVLDKIVIGDIDYKKYKKKYELYQIVKRTDVPEQSKIAQFRSLLKEISIENKDLSSFMDNAKKYSDDVTASHGGFVGKIRLGVMEEEIDKVIENLYIGKVSDIIESSIGLHLFFINSIEKTPINCRILILIFQL